MIPVILCVMLISFAIILIWQGIGSKKKKFPPGPIKLPILGNGALVKKYSHTYGGLHNAFHKMCEMYNTDILGLKLGKDYVVVVQSESLIEEVFSREQFQARPDTFFIRLRSMGTRKGITMTDGALWCEQRAFAVRHMHNLGLGKSQMEFLINEEMQILFSFLKNGLNVNLKNCISKCVLNVLWAMVTGSRFLNEDTLESLISFMGQRAKAFDMAGGVLCQFPWIRYIAPEWSGYNLIKKLNKQFKTMILDIIDKHKRTYDKEVTRDFIDAFLHEMYNNENTDTSFTDDQLIMVCLDFFIAGSQTTSSTLDFALLQMIVFPHIQQKVHDEIDLVLEKRNPVLFSDKSKLPYVEAVLLESQRFSHIIPIIGPRRVLSTTTLGGYSIPKDTTILLNLVPMLKDPKNWKDPNNFTPERFLNDDNQVIHDKFTYAFGKGKRRCPGEPLAKSFIFMFFTNFLKQYKIECVDKSNPPTLDYIPGLTLSPLPYEMKIIKR
ncbi:probable cytochrome P450 305a1 [Cimex lectularius]|uniref:Cytochrome P450 n=1 Tax=Cimex lectularius TaxID=79782 RepID=A0A8I6RD06_CIMLE|nr:probable cytochrome P450 305a1 [Cimex lectularius]